MDIKKERLEEIVKEELESFYEGEVPVEEGVGSKIANVISVMLKGQNPKDPGLEAEEQAEKEKQRSKEAQVGLAMDLRKRPSDFSKMSKTQKKVYLRNLAKLAAKKSEV